MMAPVVPPTLGKRVADCRDRLGWRQKTLAEKANLSVTFVSEVENDRRTPGADALLGLAEALGVSLRVEVTFPGGHQRTGAPANQ